MRILRVSIRCVCHIRAYRLFLLSFEVFPPPPPGPAAGVRVSVAFVRYVTSRDMEEVGCAGEYMDVETAASFSPFTVCPGAGFPRKDN